MSTVGMEDGQWQRYFHHPLGFTYHGTVFHPHPMTLSFRAAHSQPIFFCNICHRSVHGLWHYRCSLCDFDIHMTCTNTNPGTSAANADQFSGGLMAGQSMFNVMPLAPWPGIATHTTAGHPVNAGVATWTQVQQQSPTVLPFPSNGSHGCSVLGLLTTASAVVNSISTLLEFLSN